MQFLNDIRTYVEEFDSEVSEEIHRFIDFLQGKYEAMQPKDAVVAPPSQLVAAPVQAPVEEPAVEAPVEEAPVAEEAPVEATEAPAEAIEAPAEAPATDAPTTN